MPYQEVAILLGCHGFDDFPIHHDGEDAESLLVSWTALWHPQLIAETGKMPTWHRVDDPPEERQDRFWVVPRPYAGQLHPRVVREVETQGGAVSRTPTTQAEVISTAFADRATDNASVFVDDFFALGYAYLQVELLTRQMRYSTTMEETTFEEQVVSAARAAVEGDQETAKERLQSCYDFLAQERDHYYAVDVFLVDITLLDTPLLKTALANQLREFAKSNVMISGHQARQLANDAPDTLQVLQRALETQNASLVGGTYDDLPMSLLSLEDQYRQIRDGAAEIEAVTGVRPTVFGRRTFGLTPSLPQLLNKLGYRAAIHATFDGGRFPEATQSKSRWEGNGQLSIDAILRAPLDASDPATFLKLANSISDSMDMDHVATRCFAHWAGQVSPWYETLKRISQYTHALGRFVTLEEYFDETYDPGMHEKFKADQYRSPRIYQETINPLSSSVNYRRRQLLIDSLTSCRGLTLIVDDQEESRREWQEAAQLSSDFSKAAFDEARWSGQEAGWQQLLMETGRRLAEKIQRPTSDGGGLAMLNPLGFPRRLYTTSQTHKGCPAVKPPVFAAQQQGQETSLVLDAPTMGITLLGTSGGPSKPNKTPELVEENTLRNEYFEATVDPETGGLRSVRDYSTRGNRISQQLAFRFNGGQRYTKMVADHVETTQSNQIVGEIECRGRLVDEEATTVASYHQRVRVNRGNRLIELDIEIQPEVLPGDNPWDSYYASRFAWSNEATDVERSLNGIRCESTAQRFEAPLFIQLDDGKQRTAILTGGLPYHRKVGMRMLDSLLIVRGEEARRFRLGIGVDLKQPFREAQAFIAPEIIIPEFGGVAESSSNWLLHFDARHVQLLGWTPWIEEDRVVGLVMRFGETDGRPGSLGVSTIRPFESARKTDLRGQTVTQCEIDGDQLRCQVSPHEVLEIEARF